MKKEKIFMLVTLLFLGFTVVFFSYKFLIANQNDWREIRLTYGLREEVIEIDYAQKNELVKLVWENEFQEMTKEELENLDVPLGGELYCIHFLSKDDVSYRWVVSPATISLSIYEKDELKETHTYHRDEDFVRQLKKIVGG